ncbi:hypothetical protein ACNVED_16655 (plasmid) [Legionella sp. D16C41]|uniref:hypothetical protein n=1 Tax=Legionella sp. D16C41 TaxID=3402688 RepID=UPI003AF917BB
MASTKTELNSGRTVEDFSIPPPTPEMIAHAACSYSRNFILKGVTQLVNNTYDKSQRFSLARAIIDLRKLSNEYPESSLEINAEYHKFHRTVELCKKFSLGSCYELALMALDYVLRYAPPSVNAEVYYIKGGDHAFLVVGRKMNSNPNKPETWGKEAYICDPWSNKVYPASEYLSQTKNYFISRKEDGDYSNHIEDFDKHRHKLSPISLQNAEYLRKTQLQPHLNKIVQLFQKRMKAILKALEKLETNLKAIMQRLDEKYPNDPQKKEIIEKMMVKLHATVEKIRVDIKKDYTTLPYDTLRSNLERLSKESLSSFQKAVHVSEAHKAVLMKYNHEKSYATKFLRFLNIKPKTARDTHDALKEAQESVVKISGKN